MRNTYDALALFSGGLDSILAVKVVEAQGRTVKCLHFHSPFMGHPDRVAHWREVYGLDIEPVDIADAYVAMLTGKPKFGFGKTLNPCVDCKILFLRRARELMPAYGARCIISGEVLGQRPMSQRRDVLNSIRNEADVRDVLVRPLCALRLPPTAVEEAGVLDRERLHGLSGRGRQGQLRLAEEFGLTEIPTPAGGCKLAESASARRYWPVLRHASNPSADDFHLANAGRQYWAGPHWLIIGRNQADNALLESKVRPGDLVFKVRGFPGPLIVGRVFPGVPWSGDVVRDAAAFAASFSPKAVREGVDVPVRLVCDGVADELTVFPARETPLGWRETVWEEAYAERKALERLEREAAQSTDVEASMHMGQELE
ncbi:MAG: tRNA(5-methylaminomethyl-2-thiouridylate) methyltransferase [Desulfovibrionaceae bacterium]